MTMMTMATMATTAKMMPISDEDNEDQAAMTARLTTTVARATGTGAKRAMATSEAAPCPLLRWNFHVSTCWDM
jgi:hypothetical protein